MVYYRSLTTAQALAAIGQCRLIALWDSLFTHLAQPVAQILLTRNDIADVSHFPTPWLLALTTDSERDISMPKTLSMNSWRKALCQL